MKRSGFPCSIVLLLSVVVVPVSGERNMLFLGFFDQSHPAVSSDFEQRLREQLAVSKPIKLVDYVETQRYRKMVEFDRYPSLSKNLLSNLDRYITDSSLILSGKIDDITFKPVRKGLFSAAVESELRISFTIFNLHEKTFAYSMVIRGRAKRKKGRFVFGDVARVTTLSAAERHRMIDEMIDDGIRKSTGTLTSLLRSMQLQGAAPKSSADAEVNNLPSISDVFTVPSVEAAKIDNGLPDNTETKNITEETITEEPENKPDN